MIINIRAFGPLRHYLGENRQQLELPERATLQELMQVIAMKWGGSFPSQLWDAEKQQFHGVSILVNGISVQTLDTPLTENQEVMLVKSTVGG